MEGGTMPHDIGTSYTGPRPGKAVDLYVRGSKMLLEHTIEESSIGTELYARLSPDAANELWGFPRRNIARRLEDIMKSDKDPADSIYDLIEELKDGTDKA